MIEEQNFFDQLLKSDQRTYDNIQKSTTGQGNDYTTQIISIRLVYKYLENNWQQQICKMVTKWQEQI